MKIYVWTNFSKRKNSTKQPTGGTEITVELKDNTSLEEPIFILSGAIRDIVYVQALGHYYFVRDIININNGMCEIHCVQDPLATFKSDILAYTAFVERAASSYDGFINDPLLSSQQKITSIEHSSNSLVKIGGSCFVSQVLAKNKGVVLYATPDLDIFKQILIPSNYDNQSIVDWIDTKIAQAFDLDVYVGSIKWMPINATQIGTITNDFVVGPIEVGVAEGTPLYIAGQYTAFRDSVADVTIPSTYKYGDFRDCNARFSRYYAGLPGIGLVELDPIMMGSILNDNNSKLSIFADLDYVSGEVAYQFCKVDAATLLNQQKFARYIGNLSVAVPIAKSSADLGRSAATFAGAVGAGAKIGGVAGAAVGAAVGAVGAIMNELTPDTSMIGSGSGNKSDISSYSTISIYVVHYGDKEFPTAVAGRPLMQNVLLSNLSGYVKCGAASVPISGRDSDRDMINSYLNNGFYIE